MCCFLNGFLFSFYQIFPYYKTYGGYRCYFYNWNIETCPKYKLCFPSREFWRATLGAKSVVNNLCLAFLFTYLACVHFLNDVGLIRISMLCCDCGSQIFWCVDFHATFRDLLHAANLQHGTDGFTSPPKEGVLRIFSPLKIAYVILKFHKCS